MNGTADPRSGTMTARGFAAGVADFLRRADAWLDARGKWAWIAAMVAGFVTFFPLGLALLAWMIWGKQMFGFSCGHRRSHRNHERRFGAGVKSYGGFPPSGNTAFDNYRNETLRRLEDEQGAFEAFLQRLRDARDKQEFDSFMEDRARAAAAPTVSGTSPRERRVQGGEPGAEDHHQPDRNDAPGPLHGPAAQSPDDAAQRGSY